jgi:tetratricopeptide (TPR) repeat protein
MASASAYLEAGKYTRAHEEVEPLVERADRVGYAPVQAEALLLDARARAEAGGNRDVSIREGTDAAFKADRGRVDALRARAAIRVMRWSADVGKFADAENWSIVAEAALHRAGDTGDGRADWLFNRGVLLYRQGKHQQAVDTCFEALELSKRASLEPLRAAESERCLGLNLAALGRHDEALRWANDADDTLRRLVGDEHPGRIPSIYGLGKIAREANDPRGALDYLERAISLAEQAAPGYSLLPPLYYYACSAQCELGDYPGALATCGKAVTTGLRMYGPDSFHMSYAYGYMGDVLAKLNRYDDAIESYKRAIRSDAKDGDASTRPLLHALEGMGQAYLRVGKGRDAVAVLERALTLSMNSEVHSQVYQVERADLRLALARALWESGSDSQRALNLARDAADGFERIGDAVTAREADRWVATHAVR